MRLKIRTKMIVILIVIIVIPITALGILSYVKAKSVMLEDLHKENISIIKLVNDNFLNNFLDNLESNITSLAREKALTRLSEKPEYFGEVKSSWEKLVKSNKDLKWVYFGGEDGRFFVEPLSIPPKGFDPRVRPWYKEAIENDGKVVWSEPYKDALSGEIAISVAMTVRSASVRGKLIGVMGIDFTLDRFSKVVDDANTDKNGYTIITDKNGIVLTHPKKEMLNKNISSYEWVKDLLQTEEGAFSVEIDKEEYYVSYITIARTGWKLISIIPAISMLEVIQPIRNRTIFVAIVSIFLASLLGFRASYYLSKKIETISDYLGQIEKGDLTIKDYHHNDVEFGDLNRKISSMATNISKMMSEIRKLSDVDGLTQLYNHKYTYDKLDEEIKRALRLGQKLSIIMIDIDHFKRINDQFGHQTGDETLVRVANTIKGGLREIDTVGRYGGEEFLGILPGADSDACYEVAERIRKSVEDIEWEDDSIHLTVSLGMKTLEDENAVELVGKADELLYLAKKNGRNRVER